MQDVNALLAAVLGGDNESRKQAEAMLERLRGENPAGLLEGLVAVVGGAGHAPAQQLAGVLLRKCVSLGVYSPVPYDTLPPEAAAAFRAELLRILHLPSLPRPARTSLQQAVVVLAERLLAAWPEVLRFALDCSAGAGVPAEIQECAIRVLGAVSTAGAVQDVEGVYNRLVSGLQHTSPAVRMVSAEVTVEVAENLTDGDMVQAFSAAVTPLMQALTTLLQSEEDRGTEVLKKLTGLAECNPKVITSSGLHEQVLSAVLGIAKSDALAETTRCAACEFLISFGESKPKLFSASPVLPEFMDLLFRWVANLPEPSQEWQADAARCLEEDDDEVGPFYSPAEEGLDRLAQSLGSALAPLILQRAALVSAPEWQNRHAVLVTLMSTAEGCAKDFRPHLKDLAAAVLGAAGEQHPRVRQAATRCIAQFCVDFDGAFQVGDGDAIVAALGALTSDPVPRIRACAFHAFPSFATAELRGKKKRKLLEGVKQLLGAVGVPLQRPEEVEDVKCVALEALSSLAESLGEEFKSYYPQVMPVLCAILHAPEASASQRLKARAIECVATAAESAGKEAFAADASAVVGYLQSVAGQGFNDDDPRAAAVQDAWVKLAKCLGAEFAPLLPLLVPKLLEAASQEGMMEILEEGQKAEGEGVETIALNIAGAGEKNIAIRTGVIQEKEAALIAIRDVCEACGEHMIGWAEPIATAAAPQLKSAFAHVRAAAGGACLGALKAMKAGVEKGLSQQSAVVGFGLEMYKMLIDAVKEEADTGRAADFLEHLEGCLETCGGEVVPEEQLRAGMGVLHEVFKTALGHQAALMSAAGKGGDEDVKEKLREEAEEEEKLLTNCVDVMGVFLKTHGQTFTPMFAQGFLPGALEMLDVSRFGVLGRKLAVCVLVDFVDLQPDHAAPCLPHLREGLLLAGASPSDPVLARACGYGIGVCARFQCPPEFARQALTVLQSIIAAAEEGDEEWDASTCNAASALLRLQLAVGEGVLPDSEVLPTFLARLPVRSDEEEAQFVHRRVMEKFAQGSDVIQRFGGRTAVESVLDQINAETDEVLMDANTKAAVAQLFHASMP
eukprot:Hpha_TRINITY_DN16803_c1_g8::TRINITY_DN16803_c1_g8_i1::g.150572::m.150572/K20222/IPO5, KPNB3, RANBP5; importin-5